MTCLLMAGFTAYKYIRHKFGLNEALTKNNNIFNIENKKKQNCDVQLKMMRSFKHNNCENSVHVQNRDDTNILLLAQTIAIIHGAKHELKLILRHILDLLLESNTMAWRNKQIR